LSQFRLALCAGLCPLSSALSFHLDALPYLGTGKLDLRKAREIAGARAITPP
jgi:hypothetical protein